MASTNTPSLINDLKWIIIAGLIYWLACGIGVAVAVFLTLGLIVVGVLAVPIAAILGAVVCYKFLQKHGLPHAKKIVIWSSLIALIFSSVAQSANTVGVGLITNIITPLIFVLSFMAGYWVYNKVGLTVSKSILVFLVAVALSVPMRSVFSMLALGQDQQNFSSQLTKLAKTVQLYRPTYIPEGYSYYGYNMPNYHIKDSEQYLNLVYYPKDRLKESSFYITESIAEANSVTADFCKTSNMSVANGDRCEEIGKTASGEPVYVVYGYLSGTRYLDSLDEVVVQIGRTKISLDVPVDLSSSRTIAPSLWSKDEVMMIIKSMQPVGASDFKNDNTKFPQ